MGALHEEGYGAAINVLIRKRKAQGMTQAQIAASLGKPQSFVSKYERLERRLDVIEFARVASVLRLSGSEVLAALGFEEKPPGQTS